MNSALRLALALLILTCGVPLRAQEAAPAETWTLMEVYRLAEANDPVLAAALAAFQAAEEQVPQARAQLLPRAAATAYSTETDVDAGEQAAIIGDTRSTDDGYALTLSQPLYRPGAWTLYRQAKLQAEQAELQLQDARQNLVLRVAQAYFDTLLAAVTLELVQAQEEAVLEQWQQAQRSFEIGTVTITDVNEAKARLDLVRAQEIAARNELEIRQHALTLLTGVPPRPLTPLLATFELRPPAPAELEPWLEVMLARGLAVRSQRLATEIAEADVGRARAGYLPSLEAVGSYGTTRIPTPTLVGDNDTTATSVSLQFELPLFQGGAQVSRVREAIANRARARSELERVQRETALEGRQAFLGVTSGIAQVEALEQALRSSELSLKANRLGFEVGVRTAVDVLNAQQQYYNASRDLAQARFNYLLSRLSLNAAAAQLTEQDLVEIDTLLAR